MKKRRIIEDCANGALYAFNDDFLDYLKKLEIKPSDFSTEVIPKMLGRFFSYQTNSVYLDIGSPASYEKANTIAIKNENLDLISNQKMKEIENIKFDLFVSNYIKDLGSCFNKETNLLIYKLAKVLKKPGLVVKEFLYAGMEEAQVMLFT